MLPLSHVTRANLESLLRARQLDRTLTTALPPIDPHDEYAIGPSGVARLDEALGGGFPRGQLSEIIGARSSGRASLLVRLLAAATARGELVALVDALDMFDVESAEAAGVDLSRLLWIRGHVVIQPGPCRDQNQRAMEQAIRAFTLVLGAGNFGLVAFEAGEAPADAFRRLPFTTWLRLQRMIEGRQTIGLLVGSEPMARSSAGLTVKLGRPFDKLRVDLSKVEGRGISVSTRRGCRLRASGASASHAEARGGVERAEAGGPGASEEKMAGSERERASEANGGGAPRAGGIRFDGQLFEGLDVEAHVIRARVRGHEDARVALATTAAEP